MKTQLILIGWPEKALNKDLIETTPIGIRENGVLDRGKAKARN